MRRNATTQGTYSMTRCDVKQNKKGPRPAKVRGPEDYLLITTSGIQRGILPLMQWKHSISISFALIPTGTNESIFNVDARTYPVGPSEM